VDLREWEIQGMRPSFGAVRLSLYCVVRRNGYRLFLVRAGLFKTKSNIGKLKETRAGGDTAKPVFPCAFAGRSFEAMAWSDPQSVSFVHDCGFL